MKRVFGGFYEVYNEDESESVRVAITLTTDRSPATEKFVEDEILAELLVKYPSGEGYSEHAVTLVEADLS